MSGSLEIQLEWIDQPLAHDPVERATWASIRIMAGRHTATRLWDRLAQSERSSLFVPAFPVAQWIISNWWALLYEAPRWDAFLEASSGWPGLNNEWMRRHCLRAADAGLLLPRLYLFNDGREVRAHWRADNDEDYPQMPGQFVDSNSTSLGAPGDVEIALTDFIRRVLDRARNDNDNDPRVAEAEENWRSIKTSGEQQKSFCRAAGRLGLDPYGCLQTQWVDLLESGINQDLDGPLARDFLEVVDAAEVEAASRSWRWIDENTQSLRTPGPHQLNAAAAPCFGVLTTDAAQFGYAIAAAIRNGANLGADSVLKNVEDAASAAGISSFVFQDRNHLPTRLIRGAVGWNGEGDARIIGPQPPRRDSMRFLYSRGLFHALQSCQRGARLVTEAHTWDQQASRAFAAELLAPRAAVQARIDRTAPIEDLEEEIKIVADEYQVSTRVIENQLKNAV